MATMADITVYDGVAIPVQHTLKAISVRSEKGVLEAYWRENNSTLPVEAQINASLKMRELPSRVVQIEARVNVPVMEATNGANAAGYTAPPKVANIDSYVASGYFHPRSTEANRRLTRQIMINLLGGITTAVSPNSSGVLPTAFDALIMPT